jgi:glutathione S-transferase
MLADTTAIFSVLDGLYPSRRMLPSGVNGLLVHVIEEIFDEWISRVMVHYRWHFSESAAFASMLIGNGDEQIANTIRIWGPKACRATGTELPEHQLAAEKEYKALLAAMELQLTKTPYLVGGTPTAVDCAALGGLYAHILSDPDPAKVAAGYPRVVEWADSHADNEKGLAQFDSKSIELTGFAVHVLEIIGPEYKKFVIANREALQRKEKSFTVDTYGTDCSYLTRPYPEQSRQMVNHRIKHQLSAVEKKAALDLFEQFDLMECFLLV